MLTTVIRADFLSYMYICRAIFSANEAKGTSLSIFNSFIRKLQ
ncbi:MULTISPECIES: RAxF-45 family protein [Bacillus]|uniref:Uncharacterized protein n=1 Tax=Bacillus capparidis TaxID=1840411 RepID=A0ABS4CUI2_9BACI|nr:MULTISPECIES: RAxF-45 family protein [Bacillus]MBP1081000.1 hypothetical protein [Bacillus capparidis]MED1095695.1 hypothetical protein [Bacillus capparidis]